MVLFISGIDTNVGKSIATACLYKKMLAEGIRVITQKMIQTGCSGVSEDIVTHRQEAGMPFCEEDKQGLTCPYVFTHPCSPHLAAEIDGQTVDVSYITTCTRQLETRYDVVLLEGAGGLMVPLSKEMLTIDYVARQKYPVILVTSGKLGSLNHTLLSLEALKSRNIELHSIIYNQYPSSNKLIEADSLLFIREYCKTYFPDAKVELLPEYR
ncbi:MAG: dethiobiotin synthase [Prevotellaceae bacterium]|jgi:dethiobiotin synthetase|nr:dethiobiotin synthase [Prevotellaceae bacterium]